MSTPPASVGSSAQPQHRLQSVAAHLQPLPDAPAGSLPPPLDAVSSAPLPSAVEERRRNAARALLPWNRRLLDAPTGQTLRHVGEQSMRAEAAGAPIPPLFTPYSLGPLRLKNRLVVSPMCTYSADDGFLNDWHLAHLSQFAIGGAGMVIVEATAVAPEGRISPADSGLWKDEQIAPLRRIVALLASQNCRAGIQLAHAGRKSSTKAIFLEPRAPAAPQRSAVGDELGGWPDLVLSASDLPFSDGYHPPRAMSLEEIGAFKRSFVSAVRRAAAAGFDFIEVHAAHGYLLGQFLSRTSNRRTDAYGGSFANRTRLLLEVVEEARAAFSGALGVRISATEWLEGSDVAADGWTLADTVRLAGELRARGVDLLDCSSGGNSVHQRIPARPLYQLPFAAEIKRAHPQLGVAAVGLITTPTEANDIVLQGQADLVLLAREFLRDPHFPLRAAAALGFDMEWSPQYQRGKPSAASNSKATSNSSTTNTSSNTSSEQRMAEPRKEAELAHAVPAAASPAAAH